MTNPSYRSSSFLLGALTIRQSEASLCRSRAIGEAELNHIGNALYFLSLADYHDSVAAKYIIEIGESK